MSAGKAAPAPPAPDGLSDRSAALWAEVVNGWELSPAELELLRSALVALDRADEAAAVVAELGVTVADRWGSPKANPAADIEARNRGLFAAAVRQLGIKLVPDESTRTQMARKAARARWDA